MPKIIKGIKESILARAEELIDLGEYDSFSIRSIAKDCEIAVGTLYNYFKSKDEILMEVILGHWREAMRSVDERCDKADTLTECVCSICEGIRRFSERHIRFWNSSIAGGFAFSTDSSWKSALRRTIGEKFTRHAERLGYAYDPSLTPAVAEVIVALGSQCDLEFDTAIALLSQSTTQMELAAKKIEK